MAWVLNLMTGNTSTERKASGANLPIPNLGICAIETCLEEHTFARRGSGMLESRFIPRVPCMLPLTHGQSSCATIFPDFLESGVSGPMTKNTGGDRGGHIRDGEVSYALDV